MGIHTREAKRGELRLTSPLLAHYPRGEARQRLLRLASPMCVAYGPASTSGATTIQSSKNGGVSSRD